LHPVQAALAAMTLGQLHYARGEYRRAAEAFSRAAARLDPARKGEARLWAARSWLALGDGAQARAAFSELAEEDTSWADPARFGEGLAFELEGHPERALDVLEALATRVHGEIAPAVLERTFTLADRLGRPAAAEAAHRRLLREFPLSVEAAHAALVTPRDVPASVELGPFASEPRAHAVADAARHAGFSGVQPRMRETGGVRVYVVRLQNQANADAARRAADRAKRELGVPARVVTEP
jgi:tetratricopeptide (TPR) repeat protein